VSNRRLAHTYTLQAEFDGEGVLVADPYPLYPRAFLWSHLDDGIMEAVTTNWGNEGIYMQGVGPSLVGRAVPGLGPLQQINLGGALQFDADGNLAYDPTDTENQIATLTTQLTTLQQQVVALSAQVQQLYATLKSSAFNPYGQASLAGAGALTAALATPFSLAAPVMQGAGDLQAVIGFQLPTVPKVFAAFGSLTAAALNALSAQAAMSGASSAHVDLIQVPSTFKQTGSQLFAGAGGGTSRLGVGLAAQAALAGASNLSVTLPVALGSSATFAGASTSVARLIQTLQGSSSILAGAGALSSNVIFPTSTLDPANTFGGISLSNGNLTATGTNFSQAGQVRGTKSQNSGRRYLEVTFTTVSGSGNVAAVANSSYSILTTSPPGTDLNGYSWGIGQIGSTSNVEAYQGGIAHTFASSPANGDVAMIAVDLAGGKIWMGINNVWANGSGPSGAADFTFAGGTALWPVVSVPYTCVANFNSGGSAFNYALPSGFIAWG
jgi:hypothetical protein